MKRIHVLATGGTIASRSGPSGLAATVGVRELLASLGSLPAGIDLTAEDLGTRGSYAFGTSDLLDLVRRVDEALRRGADGVVITHGTDVLEESAFLLDLFHDHPQPVVLTGAQRPFDDPAPDGPKNLRDALLVAASPAARDTGGLVAFDGSVFAARGVQKVDTLASHAFAAPGRGPIMRVVGDHVQVLALNVRAQPFVLVDDLQQLPRVDVIAAYAGADAVLLDASVAAGASGVVLAALGAGNTGPALVDGTSRAVAAGIPVLVCSRVAAGPVLPLYVGGWQLKNAGAHFGRDLSPWQGRLLLAAACGVSPDDPFALIRSALGK